MSSHGNPQQSEAATRLQKTRRIRTFAFESLFVVGVLVMFLVGYKSDSMRTLSLIFASIVLEAVPFMLIGALVGGLLETFVSRERITSILPKKRWQTILLAAGLGLIFPICECAVVPVVRRLARKGLPMAAAVAYLLGGPIVNPIVAASTAVAYKLDWTVMAGRLLMGYGIAVVIGLLMDRIFAKQNILHESVMEGTGQVAESAVETCGCGHAHHGADAIQANHSENCGDHDLVADCGCGHAHHHAPTDARFIDKLLAALHHAADDFLGVGHYLIIGAFIAALAQTYIDRNIFIQLAGMPVVSILLMMILAILLNLCSEADAFIASSFRSVMPMSAQMAFMLIGPMFDLKLLLMYQTLFKKRAIVVLASLIFVIVLIVAVAAHFTGIFAGVGA